MRELEKILEEIDNLYVDETDFGIECNMENRSNIACDNCYECIKEACKNIIRKHMNDGWIPVEERLPEGKGNDGELIVTDKDGRVWSGIYYGITEETDEEPCFHKWDEEMWYCYKPDVIAWRPLPERYHPEPETEKPD